mgnify:CR=1 FL=1
MKKDDEKIDYSDIPEWTDADFASAKWAEPLKTCCFPRPSDIGAEHGQVDPSGRLLGPGCPFMKPCLVV